MGALSAAGLAGICLLSYLIGSIPIGWLAVKWRDRRDLRALGTGNVGTANIYRNVGGTLAVLVGPLQFAQGLAPVLIARAAGAPLELQALAGLFALLGNGWPVWLRFNGGRGVAVATGVVAGVSLPLLGLLLAAYVAGQLLKRLAVGVLAGFLLLPVADGLKLGGALVVPLLAIALMIMMRRLEGLTADVQRFGGMPELALRRLLLDERPGRPLVGRREDLPAH